MDNLINKSNKLPAPHSTPSIESDVSLETMSSPCSKRAARRRGPTSSGIREQMLLFVQTPSASIKASSWRSAGGPGRGRSPAKTSTGSRLPENNLISISGIGWQGTQRKDDKHGKNVAFGYVENRQPREATIARIISFSKRSKQSHPPLLAI